MSISSVFHATKEIISFKGLYPQLLESIAQEGFAGKRQKEDMEDQRWVKELGGVAA